MVGAACWARGSLVKGRPLSKQLYKLEEAMFSNTLLPAELTFAVGVIDELGHKGRREDVYAL